MKTITQKILGAALLAALSMMGAAGAWADPGSNPHDLRLSLTIGNAMAVHIENGVGGDRDNYDFLVMNLGEISVNTGVIGIDNESGGLLQTYQLSLDDAVGGMNLRGTPGALLANEYRVSALFQNAPPAKAAFDVASIATDNDIVTNSVKTAEADDATSARYVALGTLTAEDGVSTTDTLGAEVILWLQFEAPPVGSTISGVQPDFATLFVNALNQ